MKRKWKFTPYDLEAWNNSKTRIMLVAAEPNGRDGTDEHKLDMGDWFRCAHKNKTYFGNQQFYNSCITIINGYLGNNREDNINYLRFVDIKATAGGAQASLKEVLAYFEQNRDEVLKFFTSTDRDFGLAPDVVVVLGNIAQRVFFEKIRKELEIRNAALRYVFMPHPSAMVARQALLEASRDIKNRLRPVSKSPQQWGYRTEGRSRWKEYGRTIA